MELLAQGAGQIVLCLNIMSNGLCSDSYTFGLFNPVNILIIVIIHALIAIRHAHRSRQKCIVRRPCVVI